MILHSIVPPEQVMAVDNAVAYETRMLRGSYIQGVNIDGKFTVSRLISTDPALYLDPHFAPGSTLK